MMICLKYGTIFSNNTILHKLNLFKISITPNPRRVFVFCSMNQVRPILILFVSVSLAIFGFSFLKGPLRDNNERVAIDIVLLPPQEIVDQCILLNKQSDPAKYIVFSDGYMPHITLCMGSVLKTDLEKIKAALKQFSTSLSTLHLSINKVTYSHYGKAKDSSFYSFSFSDSSIQALKGLNNTIAGIVKEYAAEEGDKSMFYNPDKVEARSIQYVKTFIKEHSGNEKYDPHISLGNCKGICSHEPAMPIPFRCSQLAMFQLGPYGTCNSGALLYLTNIGSQK